MKKVKKSYFQSTLISFIDEYLIKNFYTSRLPIFIKITTDSINCTLDKSGNIHKGLAMYKVTIIQDKQEHSMEDTIWR